MSDIILLCQGYSQTGKNTNKKFSCVMVLIMTASSSLNFQFVYCFNECLWAIFSLLNFENFWLYIWVVVVWLLIYDTNDFKSLFMPCRWVKNLSANTTNYILKCWERSAKRKSNLNFIRVIKKSSFNQHFLNSYIRSKPF